MQEKVSWVNQILLQENELGAKEAFPQVVGGQK